MSDLEIIERLKSEGFYDFHDFYMRTGIVTTTIHYGTMGELYSLMNAGKKLKTSCAGCIANCIKQIGERWHL